jgi:hypothetical protein
MIVKAMRMVVIVLVSAVALAVAGPHELAEEAEGITGGECPCAYTNTCSSLCGGASVESTGCSSTPLSGSYTCASDSSSHPCGIAIKACANVTGVQAGATTCPE